MPAPARILVVEDDETIRTSVLEGLVDVGFACHGLADGNDLETVLEHFRPDAVILDWMLPGRDGIVLAAIIGRRSSAAVILLTARDALPDRLRGFAQGVDDYVVKPFAMAELEARLRAVLRRSGAISSTIQIDDLTIDESAATVTRDGKSVDLTATELRLLTYLAQNRDRVVSPTQILTQVWGYENYDDNLVQVHISALRRKLEAYGPRLIDTRRGLGYVLRAPTS